MTMAVKTSTTLRFAVLLTLTNGFLDAYTYITRGGVFANVEAGYSVFVDKDNDARLAFRVYGTLIGTFASGAVIGAFTSEVWGIRAVWAAAAFLAVTLVLFIVDEREGKEA